MSKVLLPAQTAKSSHLEKRVEGFCLIMAPVLLAASSFFWENGEYGVESAMLIIFSMFFWITGLTGLFSLVKNDMPRYAVWGRWVAVFGCISGVCFAFLGYLVTALNISHEDYLKLLSQHPLTSQVLLFGSGPLFPLSFLILGIILMLRRSVPLWISISFCVAAITFPFGRIPPRTEWLAHLTDLALLVPSIAIGWKYLRSDD